MSQKRTLNLKKILPQIRDDRHLDLLAQVHSPERILLSIDDAPGTAYGCDQDWYPDAWQRRAGCGPSTATTMLYYLSHEIEALSPLYTAKGQSQEDLCHFMAEIWQYVTPGRMGLNEGRMLSEGIQAFAHTHGIEFDASLHKISGLHHPRPPEEKMIRFILEGLKRNCPVAFLNLSNGDLRNLESWHWVTITALFEDRKGHRQALISDSGEAKLVDVSRWYRKSLLGGTFVHFRLRP